MSTENLWKEHDGKGFHAQKADYAVRASTDEHGNLIDETYATKSETDQKLLGKVDTVSGKDLSTNDYTDADKDTVATVRTWSTGYYDIPDASEIVRIGGRAYAAVQIGTQIWMAENLDFQWDGLDVGTSGISDTNPKANYYDDNPEQYPNGLLYNWPAASYLNTNASTLGIPDGWHVPTNDDFSTLMTSTGGISNACKKLKSTTGWFNDGNGTDDYGFNMKPNGRLDVSGYDYNTRLGSLWSMTKGSGSNSYNYKFQSGRNEVEQIITGDDCEFSIRLVKNIN